MLEALLLTLTLYEFPGGATLYVIRESNLTSPAGAGTEADAAPKKRRAAASFPAPSTLVRVGDVATFSGSYGVSGKAEIVGPNAIRLTMFRANGTAPGIDLRVGLASNSRRNFTVLRVTGRQSFSNATIDLSLPPPVDLNAFDTFTVWCYEFNVIIAEGRFRRP